MMCGMRQGGMLSPLLFSVYVDMIQKFGMRALDVVGDVYYGRVMYADDLIPVSASVNLLQRMIGSCCEDSVYLAVCLDIMFDASKSNIIRYGPKCTHFSIELHVDSIASPCVNRVKYM